MQRDELLAALAAATGPDRALDAEIAEWLGDRRVMPLTANANSGEWMRKIEGEWKAGAGRVMSAADIFVPRYTASLDAAMTLVPEGWRLDLSTDDHASFPDQAAHATVMSRPWADPDCGDGSVVAEGHAATPALALCIAALTTSAP